jgi:asparagine synthase (glutamine-hydrolysing)
MSLGSSCKVEKGAGKQILKKAASERLPKEIIHRKKMGFPVPLDQWFSNDLFPVISERIRNSDLRNLIDEAYIERILRRQQEGTENHGKLIMSLLVLDTWKSTFLDSPRPVL